MQLPHLPEFPEVREIASPITDYMLRPLDARCRLIQWRCAFTDHELRRLSEFLRAHSNVEVRVYGHHIYGEQIADLGFLRYFPFLRRFLVELYLLDSLDGLRVLPPSLEYLGIGQTHRTVSLQVLRAFPNLRKLYLERHHKDFEAISTLSELERLTLRSITVPDLSALVPLKNLWWLAIKLGGTNKLALLPSVGRLKYLELWQIRGLTNIEPVGQVRTLQCLFLQSLKHITELPSFRELKDLRALYIESLRGLQDLSPITEAEHLEELAFINSPNIRLDQLVPLKNMRSLKSVAIGLGSSKRNLQAKGMFNLPSSTNIIKEFVRYG